MIIISCCMTCHILGEASCCHRAPFPRPTLMDTRITLQKCIHILKSGKVDFSRLFTASFHPHPTFICTLSASVIPAITWTSTTLAALSLFYGHDWSFRYFFNIRIEAQIWTRKNLPKIYIYIKNLSHVSCHESCVTCHLLPVICQLSAVKDTWILNIVYYSILL